ncbi:acylneuraminate cytidylyltransferase family protein [Hwanghaeella grinnelliae]|uniref:Acylneuraminate cytidylyltransferase family protein n=1 Tax=Hwanghaeella grinnelliae TaxID=2500179 RepID=A0A437QQH4_9PROT|nr:acylneuraminate cytidylyltransferase family protein [Hwanghaeella grinnelliae]RVU36762.1 acylneuraminate cytidylyltransferase family protein [Hwanghaeella grinnelliae]
MKLALIPARGGSKRLPRKNIADFLGKPIIAHTIAAAQNCGIFDHVVVSSDDDEIIDVAAKFGAEIIARPKDLGSDSARVTDVCLHAMQFFDDRSEAVTELCCLYATAPLRTGDDIAAVHGLLGVEGCGFAMAVSTYPLPPHQALRATPAGTLEPMWPDLVSKRESDLPTLLVDNGSTYSVNATAFKEHRTFYGPGLRGHVMPQSRSIDINTREDLVVATAVASSR